MRHIPIMNKSVFALAVLLLLLSLDASSSASGFVVDPKAIKLVRDDDMSPRRCRRRRGNLHASSTTGCGAPRQRSHNGQQRRYGASDATRALYLFPRILGSSILSVSPTKVPIVSPPTSLIRPDDAWGNWFVLLGTASASQVLGKTTSLGRLLGPPVTAMALTFALATVGILNPGGTDAAQSLQTLALQLATPLILLGADLQGDTLKRCGPLLVSFAVASVATSVACVAGWKLAGPALQAALGPRDGLILAAALLAKNIGGGINYVAVCSSLRASPTAVAAGLCVDNLFALLYFPATSALASGRRDIVTEGGGGGGTAIMHDTRAGAVNKNEASGSAGTITVESISSVLWLAAGLSWMGRKLGKQTAALPVTTVLTVLLASSRAVPSKWMEPIRPAAECLGTAGLYVFFATAGAPGVAVAESVRASLLPLSAFLMSLYSIHAFVLVACHKIGGEKMFGGAFLPQRLLVASSAAIGGPATAVALAQAANWNSLKVPSLIVGNIGYAIATFCGLAYYALFR